MAQRKEQDAETDFPRGIGRPATRALQAAGYTRLDQLAGMREADLAKLHGVGPKALGVLRSALNERGQSFADG
jgi:predicted flap endonuclease-1-like 5' DNA nuclease